MFLHRGSVVLFGLLVGAANAQGARPRAKEPDITKIAPKPLLEVRHQGEVVSVAFSPDGKTLAAGSGHNGVFLWDATTGKLLRRIEGRSVGDNLAFSHDGRLLAVVRNWQQDQEGNIVQLFDPATGKVVRRIAGHGKLVRAVAFSPDGKHLATNSEDKTARVWEVATGKELRRFQTSAGPGHVVAFSPDGKVLAFDDGYSVRLVDPVRGKGLFQLIGHRDVDYGSGSSSGYLNDIAFSADGTRLVSASCDHTARIWDVRRGMTRQVLRGHRHFVNAAAFTPGGLTVLTAGEDGTVRVWDTATGKQVKEVPAHVLGPRKDGDTRRDVFAVVVSPDGKRVATGGRDGFVRVWELAALLRSGKSP